jgi:general secretion pathway protein G
MTKSGRARRRRAFTLIEMMAVIAIIGLLIALIGPAIAGMLDNGRITTTEAQIRQIEAALTSYQMDNGRYPTTEQGLRALIEKPTSAPEPYRWRPGGYLARREIPRDGWKNEIQYAAPGEHNPHAFDVWSLGADGQPGGTDADADIGNWSSHESEE